MGLSTVSLVTRSGTDKDDNLQGTSGSDNLSGRGGNDRISGGSGHDRIDGGKGNDRLYGDGGNDHFIATNGDGDDRYDGGDGIDTYDLSATAAASNVNLVNGTATSGKTGSDKLVNIENVIGSQGANILSGDASDNLLRGLAGNDTLWGNAGNDTLDGGAGNDFYGTAIGNDVIVLQPGFGNDRVNLFDANKVGGQDMIDISAFHITAGDFAARVVITDIDADTLVTIDGNANQTIRLGGVADHLTVTQNDFVLLTS